jgi:hypothetical protein
MAEVNSFLGTEQSRFPLTEPIFETFSSYLEFRTMYKADKPSDSVRPF